MKTYIALLLGSFISFSSLEASQAYPKPIQQQAVQALEKSTYSPSLGRAKVTKIVFAAPYALADWQQGEIGGLATLVYTPQGWRVISPSTRGWPGFNTFIKERQLPPDKAAQMLDQIFPDWRKWER